MGASPLRLRPRRRGIPTVSSLAAVLTMVVGASTACDPREPAPPAPSSPPPTTTPETPSPSLGTVSGTAPPPARSRSTPKPLTFDHTDVQDAVYSMLARHYRINDVQLVICPPNRPVVRGTTFRCTATIAGGKTSVPIKVTSDNGDYVVGRPK
ncbi:MAG: DUF4333 domain-containing protein [Actinophytocola sp.]|nr:DUF4333 domain-containing protein [Actinophytocola sp.]